MYVSPISAIRAATQLILSSSLSSSRSDSGSVLTPRGMDCRGDLPPAAIDMPKNKHVKFI
jgi:hypothetical protein